MARDEHSKTGSNAKAPHCPAEQEHPVSRQDQEMIGRELQRFYAGLVAEGIPEKFKDLLDRLGATDRSAEPSRKPEK
jgi:hypothetical protein